MRKHIDVGAISTHIGGSTLRFAEALCGTSDHFTTIDVEDVNAPAGPWRGPGLTSAPRQLLAEIVLSAHFVVSNSVEYLRRTDGSFDLIFIDGDRARQTVLAEIAAALRLLRSGGTILLHDYFPDGTSCWRTSSPILEPYEAVLQLQRDGRIQPVPLGASLAALVAQPPETARG